MKKQDELVLAFSNELLPGIAQIIEQAKQKTALFLNAETTLMYWSIGHFINQKLKKITERNMAARFLLHCRNN